MYQNEPEVVEIEDSVGVIELAFTDPETLINEIDALIEDLVLPESYLRQLTARLLERRIYDFDLTRGKGLDLENAVHIQEQIRVSYLLFCARVIGHEIAEMLRRAKQKKLSSQIYEYIKLLENISRTFDNSYRDQLGVVNTPALNGTFWMGRGEQVHPAKMAERLITEAYVS